MRAEIHAKNSVRRYGGVVEDYLPLHKFMDQARHELGDVRHRLITHNTWFIRIAEQILGEYVKIDNGVDYIPVRMILEDHVREDMGGRLPTLEENFRSITPEAVAGDVGVFEAILRLAKRSEHE